MFEKKPTFIEFSETKPGWEGHVAFSESACIEWGNKFSVSSYWKPHPTFGKDSRKVLEKLSPPFYPEDEFLVWDPGIDRIGSPQIMFISKVISHQFTLDEGLCFGTDFRMIWGNRFSGAVSQLLYREFRSVEKNQNLIKIFAEDEKVIEIVFSSANSLEGASQFADTLSFDPFNLLFEFFQIIVDYNHTKMVA